MPSLLTAPYTSFASLHLPNPPSSFSTIAITHTKGDSLKSKSGSAYASWTLGMLSNTHIKLLLFGAAYTAHHKNLSETGRAFLIIDPKVLPPSNPNYPGPPTYSVSRADQLRHYATAAVRLAPRQ